MMSDPTLHRLGTSSPAPKSLDAEPYELHHYDPAPSPHPPGSSHGLPPNSYSSPPVTGDIWSSQGQASQGYADYSQQLAYTPSYVGSYPGSEYSGDFGGRSFDVSDDEFMFGPPRHVDEDASSQHADEYDPAAYDAPLGSAALSVGSDQGIFEIQQQSLAAFTNPQEYGGYPTAASASPASSARARSRASSVSSFHGHSPNLAASQPPNPISDFGALSFNHPSSPFVPPTPPMQRSVSPFAVGGPGISEPSPPPSHLMPQSPGQKPQSPPQLMIPGDQGTSGGLAPPQPQGGAGNGLLGVGGPQINLTPATPISALTAKPGDNQRGFQDILRDITAGRGPSSQGQPAPVGAGQRFPQAPGNPQHPVWPPPAQQHTQPPLLPSLPPFGAQFGNYAYAPRVRSKSETNLNGRPQFGGAPGWDASQMGGMHPQQQHQQPTTMDPSILLPSTSQQQGMQTFGAPPTAFFPDQMQLPPMGGQHRRTGSMTGQVPSGFMAGHNRQSRSLGGSPSMLPHSISMPGYLPTINPNDGTLLPPMMGGRETSLGPDRRGRRLSHGSGASTPYSRSPSPGPGMRPLRDMVTTPATAAASQGRRTTKASFVCPIPGCGSTFTRSFNLKGHLRSHNEERPFKCHWPGCEKGFARQHDCKRHEALHLNIRPFTCEGCGRNFARMDALNRHLRSEGGNECAKTQQPLTEESVAAAQAAALAAGGMDMEGMEGMDVPSVGQVESALDDSDAVPMTAPSLEADMEAMSKALVL